MLFCDLCLVIVAFVQNYNKYNNKIKKITITNTHMYQ